MSIAEDGHSAAILQLFVAVGKEHHRSPIPIFSKGNKFYPNALPRGVWLLSSVDESCGGAAVVHFLLLKVGITPNSVIRK